MIVSVAVENNDQGHVNFQRLFTFLKIWETREMQTVVHIPTIT